MYLPKSQQNRKQEFYNPAFIAYQILTLNFVCEMVLISVSATNYKLLWFSLILVCPHLDLYKRKTPIFALQEGKKLGP